jgi:hypothetical protein
VVVRSSQGCTALISGDLRAPKGCVVFKCSGCGKTEDGYFYDYEGWNTNMLMRDVPGEDKVVVYVCDDKCWKVFEAAL